MHLSGSMLGLDPELCSRSSENTLILQHYIC